MHVFKRDGDGIKKLLTAKIFYVLLALNNLVLSNVLSSITLPPSICNTADIIYPAPLCNVRLTQLVVLLEVLLFMSLMSINFPPSDHYDESVIGEKDTSSASRCKMILLSIRYFDTLGYIFNSNHLVNVGDKETQMIVEKPLVVEVTKQLGKEGYDEETGFISKE